MTKNLWSEFDCHYCQNDHDYKNYEYNGNCPYWITKDITQLRKLKLQKITTDEKHD